MVPDEHRQPYKELQQALESLRRLASTEALTVAVAKITQQFQQQILPLNLTENPTENLTEKDEAIALRLQSIQTEISKQLRLLAMDTMFLKTARQPETNQQRRQQMGDRLDLLQRYCEAILTTDSATKLATDLATDPAPGSTESR